MSCIKCDSLINEKNDKIIRCDGCNRPIHVACSELSPAEIKCFELRPSARRRIKYICIHCEPGFHQIPKLINLINEFKEDARKLNESNKDLSDGTVPSSAITSTSVSVTEEEIINEMLKRNRRSYNFIIHGCVEIGDNKQNQIGLDEALAKDILKESGFTDTNVKPVRLGKFGSTKQHRARPMSYDNVITILRKFKKLKDKEIFAPLSLSPDRTPKQVSLYKTIKSELNSHIQKGESNLFIKYRNGIPTILKRNSENQPSPSDQ